MGKREKRAKYEQEPSGAKRAKVGIQVENALKMKPAWQLSQVDFEGPYGWGSVDRDTLLGEIHAKLANFETMTWDEILKASGGRSSGNNSHEVEVDKLSSAAQQRLTELRQLDLDSLFSLRLSGKGRVWGVRDGRVLRVLWYDPDHQVCPTAR